MSDMEQKRKEDLENWKTLYKKGLVSPSMVQYVKLIYHYDLHRLDQEKDNKKDNKNNKKKDKGRKKQNPVSKAAQKKQLTIKKAAQQKIKKVAKKIRLKIAGKTFKAAGKVCKAVGRGMQAMANVTEKIAQAMKKAARAIAKAANKMMEAYAKSIISTYGISALAAPVVVAAYAAMMGASAACAATSFAMFATTRTLRTVGRIMETTVSRTFENLGQRCIDKANSISTNVDMNKVNQEVNQEMQQRGNENSGNLLDQVKSSAGNAMEGGAGGGGASAGNEGDKSSGHEFFDAAVSTSLDILKNKSGRGNNQKKDVRSNAGDATQVMSGQFVNRLKGGGRS